MIQGISGTPFSMEYSSYSKFQHPPLRNCVKCPNQFFCEWQNQRPRLSTQCASLKTWVLQTFPSEPLARESEFLTLPPSYSYFADIEHLLSKFPTPARQGSNSLPPRMTAICPWVARGNVKTSH